MCEVGRFEFLRFEPLHNSCGARDANRIGRRITRQSLSRPPLTSFLTDSYGATRMCALPHAYFLYTHTSPFFALSHSRFLHCRPPADGTAEGYRTQDDFMAKDECIVLNYNDEVLGPDNKYNVHKFLSGQPKGVCHRAFSVMLFDAEGRLLLQQRAASKITFPKVWTNTCCSHPLFGQVVNEVDEPLKPGAEPMGVKHAAVRKIRHELGTKAGALDASQFKYMGRVHYWAADTVTWGPNAPWGEHEIDYLLLYQLPKGTSLAPIPSLTR